jgi:hypothetical protein
MGTCYITCLLIATLVLCSLQQCSGQTAYVVPSMQQDSPGNHSYMHLGSILARSTVLKQYDTIMLTSDDKIQVRPGLLADRNGQFVSGLQLACSWHARCRHHEKWAPAALLGMLFKSQPPCCCCVPMLQPSYLVNATRLLRNLTVTSANYSTEGYKLLEVRPGR